MLNGLEDNTQSFSYIYVKQDDLHNPGFEIQFSAAGIMEAALQCAKNTVSYLLFLHSGSVCPEYV